MSEAKNGKYVDSRGNIEWYKDGRLHREDGPAVESITGYKAWYFNGKPHRKDGPAFNYGSGDKQWFINGQRHREDGPAVEMASGRKCWYLHGMGHTEEEFNDYLAKKQFKDSLLSDLEQKEERPKVKI